MFKALLLCLFLSGVSHADDGRYFHLTSFSEQLSNPWVNTILEDQYGYVWVGTEEGLNRIDPQGVVTFKGENATALGLDDSVIVALENINQDQMLVATSVGLYVYHFEQNRFQQMGSESLLPNYKGGGVYKLAKTANGDIWILAYDGLYLLAQNGHHLTDWTPLLNQNELAPGESYVAMAVRKQHQLSIASQHEILTLDTKQSTLSSIFTSTSAVSNAAVISSLAADEQNSLWVGTRSGAFKLNGKGRVVIASVAQLKNKQIVDILPGNNGKTWFTSDVGLFVYDDKTQQAEVMQTPMRSDVQNDRQAFSVLYRTSHGSLWVGTQGAGLDMYLPLASHFQQINSASKLPFALRDNTVWAMHEDEKYQLVATDLAVHVYNKASKKLTLLALVPEPTEKHSDELIYSIKAYKSDYILAGEVGLFLLNGQTLQLTNLLGDSEQGIAEHTRVLDTEEKGDYIWVATDKGLYEIAATGLVNRHFNLQNGLTDIYVKDIEIDENGVIWIASRKGISALDATGKFHHYLQTEDSAVAANEFTKIYALKPGFIIASAYNVGVYAVDYSAGFNAAKIENMNTTWGLTHKNIFSIARANKQYLLMGTDDGLYRINLMTGQSELYFQSDGMPASEFNEGAAFCAPKWGCSFGSTGGLVNINAGELHHRINKTTIYASELKIHYASKPMYWRLNPSNKIQVDEDHRALWLKFTNLDYLGQKHSALKYRLLPGNEKYIMLGASGELFLSALTPGNYQLEVLGMQNGQWLDKPYRTQIEVQPAWWQRQLVRMLAGFVACGILFLLVYNRIQYVLKIKKLNSELKQRKQTLQMALWGSDTGIWEWDGIKQVYYVHQPGDDSFSSKGIRIEESSWVNRLHRDDLVVVQKRWQAYLSQPQLSYQDEYRLAQKGENVWFAISGKSIAQDATGKSIMVIGTYRNVSKHKSLQGERRLLGKALENITEGVIIINEHLIIHAMNSAAETITGYSRQALIKQSVEQILVSDLSAEYNYAFSKIKNGENWSGELQIKCRDGELCPLWLSMSLVSNETSGVFFVATFVDITERKQAEQELRWMASHDTLTQVANRTLFEENLKQDIIHALFKDEKFALLFIDLDRFKMVNDLLGHSIGDQLLVQVAARIQNAIGPDDLLARFGGDEFVILLRDIDSLDTVNHTCEQIIQAFTRSFECGKESIKTGLSIGISICPQDGTSCDQLIKHADMAMYHAKENGRNNFQYYSLEQNQVAQARLVLEKELQDAVEKQQFVLHYQPQVNAKSGDIIGVEALIRWSHPIRGLVAPDDFIPIAESTGLIVPLSEWLLDKAIEDVLGWQKTLGKIIKLSINVSVRHFSQPSFVDSILLSLNKSEFPANKLCLEIVESMLMENMQAATASLDKVRQHGVQVAIDDFGTGYSSLAYLKHLPIDSLKIDKSFVLNLSENESDEAIVKCIVALGKNLGFNIIAEGVETQISYQLLQQMGCHQVQGYYFSRPLAQSDALKFLQSAQSMTSTLR